MQEIERLELHHPYVDRGGHCIPARGDTRGHGHYTPHHLQLHHGDIELRHSQRAHSHHQLFHHRLLSHQLCYILRHVEAV